MATIPSKTIICVSAPSAEEEETEQLPAVHHRPHAPAHLPAAPSRAAEADSDDDDGTAPAFAYVASTARRQEAPPPPAKAHQLAEKRTPAQVGMDTGRPPRNSSTDDTDHAHDEVEFRKWEERKAKRRVKDSAKS